MKKNIFKKILGTMWNLIVVWWTLPLFIIMILTATVSAIKAGINMDDEKELEEYCMKNVLFRIYKKVTITV